MDQGEDQVTAQAMNSAANGPGPLLADYVTHFLSKGPHRFALLDGAKLHLPRSYQCVRSATLRAGRLQLLDPRVTGCKNFVASYKVAPSYPGFEEALIPVIDLDRGCRTVQSSPRLANDFAVPGRYGTENAFADKLMHGDPPLRPSQPTDRQKKAPGPPWPGAISGKAAVSAEQPPRRCSIAPVAIIRRGV